MISACFAFPDGATGRRSCLVLLSPVAVKLLRLTARVLVPSAAFRHCAGVCCARKPYILSRMSTTDAAVAQERQQRRQEKKDRKQLPKQGGGESNRGRGGGGGGGGGGGRGRGSAKLRGLPKDSHDVRVSKTLSWILRHGSQSEGLAMRKDGYVRVSDLVRSLMCSHECFNPLILRKVACPPKNARAELRGFARDSKERCQGAIQPSA